MCGINGFVDFSGLRREDATARVRRMSDALIHRGPDEHGLYVDEHAALGHRRLAIIDLSSGQQPMRSADGQVTIVFNGEIYNFPEVRAELEAAGHRFRTNCDTEVILAGYQQWAEQCVERLNGMFAFAIWDARGRKLLLARDRVGKKPLYYFRSGSLVMFASELKALRAAGGCPETVDAEALDCYFSLGYIPAPRTIYQGVRKLRAGHTLVITDLGETERHYWDLSFANPIPRTLEAAIDEFEPLFDDAVKCRLMSEVPLGAFLSGGLDSSLVVSSMARVLGRPVMTNSIGFEDAKFDELSSARVIADALHTDHHEFVVKPRAADVLERIAWHFDEPLADSSALPTWYVCEMARRTVTVALSGDGGDEGFGGYTFRYIPHMLESRIRAVVPTSVRSVTFGALGALWPASARLPKALRLKTIFENLAVGDAQAFYRDLACLREDARSALYSPGFLEKLKGFTPLEAVVPYYVNSDAPDALGRSQFTDIHSYMTDDVLVKVDRMSMAHSLEVRSPLLDHRLLEFAARLPSSLRVGARRGKLLLHALAERRLPRQVLNKPKRGFAIPAAKWLRTDLRALAQEVMFDVRNPAAEVLDRGELDRLWRQHLTAERDHSTFLWGLMMLGLWGRMMRPAPAPLASMQ